MRPADPFALFEQWMAEAESSEALPTACSLATATPDAVPSVRMVLLKDWGREGFVVYTNLDSRKGRELEANPRAALCVHWKSLGRQVRINGRVQFVSDATADAYFATRPRGSQLGAWASQQSAELADRQELHDALAATEQRFPAAVPRPPRWTGAAVIPDSIEFWMDRPDRLHDRWVYRREADWAPVELNP
jgi:pyridoxamine 5'-phosphate oxidase